MVNWPEIVEQYGPCVWRTAYRLLSDREEANECYQETFLGAMEYSRRQEVTHWPALLRRIATSKALDRLRTRYRKPTKPLEEDGAVIGNEPSPDAALLHQEWMEQLRQTLTELPEQQANVFWLSEVERMTHTEIAEQLNVSTKKIATWLHRAKQKLRRLLAEREFTGEVQS